MVVITKKLTKLRSKKIKGPHGTSASKQILWVVGGHDTKMDFNQKEKRRNKWKRKTKFGPLVLIFEIQIFYLITNVITSGF